jgi:O-antigen/teichoic acid export membrane protein
MGKVYELVKLLRKGPFDTATEEGRSANRYRRLILTASSSVVSRIITVGTSFISVPLALNYLGTERYGLWVAISSVISMLAFADLGMGLGLLNTISEADGTGDRTLAQRSVSTAFITLSAIAATVVGIAVLLYPVLPWARIFNVTSHPAIEEVGPAVLVLAICFALNLPIDTVERVQSGFQEGFVNNLWQSGAALVGLVFVLAAIHVHASLPALVAGLAGAPLIVKALNWGVHFSAIRPWLFPKLRHFDRRTAVSLTKTGLTFLTLNAFILVGYSSDTLIITQILGPAAVVPYAIVQKLFYTTHVSEFLIAPLWPAFGEALARGDYDWIRRTIRGSLKFNLAITAITGIALVIFGRPLVQAWTLSKVVPAISLLISFAVWRLLSVYQGIMSVFLNHESLLRRQVKFFGTACVCSLALKLIFVRLFAVPGVVWATILAFAIFYVPAAWRCAFGYLGSRQLTNSPQVGVLATAGPIPSSE